MSFQRKSGSVKSKDDGNFRKAASVEPQLSVNNGSTKRDGQKKSLISFWHNLFRTQTKIPEVSIKDEEVLSTSTTSEVLKPIEPDRKSIHSTSSGESDNSDMSSYSFSFISPKRYKGKACKGKRIPVDDSTLPISDVKSKENKNTIQIANNETPSPSPSPLPLQEQQQSNIQARKPNTLTRLGMKIGLKKKYNLQSCESLNQFASNHNLTNGRSSSPLVAKDSESQVSSQNNKVVVVTDYDANALKRRDKKQIAPPPPVNTIPEIVASDDVNSTVVLKSVTSISDVLDGRKREISPAKLVPRLFEHHSGRKRYSGVDFSPSPQRTPNSTLNRCYVKGKRRAPIPPNPFEVDDDELENHEKSREVAQNISNDKKEALQQNKNQPPVATEKDVKQANSELETLIAVSSTLQQQAKTVNDEVKSQLVQLKKEAETSPLSIVVPKSNSVKANQVSQSTSVVTNVSSTTTISSSSSTVSQSPITTITEKEELIPAKVVPKPWYKRNPSAFSSKSKNSKTTSANKIYAPISHLPKFSELDKEATRIVEENRRKSAEQSYNESARELITMFSTSFVPPPNETQSAKSQNDVSNPSAQKDTSNESNSMSISSGIKECPTTSKLSVITTSSPTHSSSSCITNVTTASKLVTTVSTTDTSANNQVRSPLSTTIQTFTANSPIASTKISTTNQNSTQPTVTPCSSNSNKEQNKDNNVKKLDVIAQTQTNKIVRIPPSTISTTSVTTSNTPSTATTSIPNLSTSTTITPPIMTSVHAPIEWPCPRCTLNNPHWKVYCDACYYRKDSLPPGQSAVSSILAKVNEASVKSKVQKSDSPSTNVSSSSNSFAQQKQQPIPQLKSINPTPTTSNNIPPCENFLSQIPSKTLGKQGKLQGLKFQDAELEELNMEKVRQARLAKFDKNHKLINDEPNNLDNDTSNCNADKESNVFYDAEDDTIDSLLQNNNEATTQDNSPRLTTTKPSFQQFQQRFRPMLEAIFESVGDEANRIYEALTIYENWHLERNESPTKIPTNTFMPNFYFPSKSPLREEGKNFSSSESEESMDRRLSRRHSSHQSDRLSSDDYRRLAKTHREYYNMGASTSSGSSRRNSDVPFVSSSNFDCASGNTSRKRSDGTDDNSAVNKLLRNLERAIAEGNEIMAASAAHDLALLRISCVLAKSDITIRVYVEDRFMQQGPFSVFLSTSMTLKELRLKIESDWGIPNQFQKWILGRKIAEDDEMSLSDYDVIDDSMAFLYLVTPQIETAINSDSAKRSLKKESSPALPPKNNRNSPIPSSSANVEKVQKSETVPQPKQQVTSTASKKTLEVNEAVNKTNEKPSTSKPVQHICPVHGASVTVNKKVNENKAPSQTQQTQQQQQKSKSDGSTQSESVKKKEVVTDKVTNVQENGNKEKVPSESNKKNITPVYTTQITKSLADAVKTQVKAALAASPQIPRRNSVEKSRQSQGNSINSPLNVKVSETSNKNTQSVPMMASPPRPPKKSDTLPKVDNKIKENHEEKKIADLQQKDVTPIPTKRRHKGQKKVVVEKVETSNEIEPTPVLSTQVPKPKIYEAVVVSTHTRQTDTDKNISTPNDRNVNTGNVLQPTLNNISTNTKHDGSCQTTLAFPRVKSPNVSKDNNNKVVETNRRPSDPIPTPVSEFSPVNSPPSQETRKNSDSSVSSLVIPITVSEKVLESTKVKVLPIENGHAHKNEVKEPEKIVAAAVAIDKKEDNVQTYLNMMEIMEKQDLIKTTEEIECLVCLTIIKKGEGIVLKDCLHCFCADCLIGAVKYAEDSEVKCPYRDKDYSCNSILQEREIKALVPPDIFEKYLALSVKIAECKMVNTFHCQTPNCIGWAVYEDDVNIFNCPICKKRNCITCQAIHENLDCLTYQRQLAIAAETDENAKSSRLFLEQMIQRGEALECPACHVVILKKWGCHYVKCSYCKTEICWITKQRRWGPNGKGDISGGCRCGVGGIKCHPLCNYCH